MLEPVKHYLAGEVPLARVFLHHMLVIGTLVNVATGLLALGAFASDLPAWVAVLIFFSPLPYNLVLSIAVWRSAGKDVTRLGDFARIGVLIWFSLMFLI